MDSDLQHPPEAIEKLLAEWRGGFKIVNTRRDDEQVANIFKRTTSKWFYRFFSYLADIPIEDGASDFRLLDRDVLEVLLKFAHADGFIRGSVQWMGYPSTIVPYEANSRFAGQSKYTIKRMFKFAMTALTSFSTKPLRLGVWLGLAVAVLAMFELAYVLWQAMEGRTVEGWASTVGVLSFLFGVLFALLGIMGIYLARIYSLLQARPFFIIHSATDGGETTAEQVHSMGD
jgi:dolichol-phosphate mannosyltransferase